MNCRKCGESAPDNAKFCPYCGLAISNKSITKPKHKPKTRGNGQGSVYKIGKTWAAAKVFSYEAGENGRSVPIRTVKRGFATKTAALNYLALMQPPKKESKQSTKNRVNKNSSTVKQIYDLWLPTHKAREKSKSTIGCYTAAFKHFAEVWDVPFAVMSVDDWQDCIDDCGRGRRTKENMKALVSLLYKYAIPRNGTATGLNLSEYLFVAGEKGRRHPFKEDELKIIEKHIGTVDYADYIYCNCYLGYRPTEFITRTINEHYNSAEQCIYGGIKTKAGQERVVTISPKILPIVKRIIGDRTEGEIFCRYDGQPFTAEKYREVFAEALIKMGIESTDERKLTPYSCRHTFASLADKITGSDNAKLELMGHTEVEMLRHYQHADLVALRSITDSI